MTNVNKNSEKSKKQYQSLSHPSKDNLITVHIQATNSDFR